MGLQRIRTDSIADKKAKIEAERLQQAVLMQAVAGLTIENAELKGQIQTLAQAIALMQIGGEINA